MEPDEIYIGREDYLCVFDDEATIKRVEPDFQMLSELKSRGVIVTAKGFDVDFVCRFFAPAFGIDEDPATGSIQTTLVPYWSRKLGKEELTSLQVSKRTGYFRSKLSGDRVLIAGEAVTYLSGFIEL
jgi:predicted PhzF superfamily epimerase YddE/YHI9